MELQGEQVIRAPRQRVWEALNDPAVLSRCIPGCEELEKITDTETHARLMAKIGPVRARFSGKILMSDIEAPARCTLSFEGAGGAAGFAKGKSVVTLEEQGDDTCLRYSVHAAVGGKLGQIGGRLVDSSARKMADEFFLAFNNRLVPPSDQAADAHPGASASGPAVEVGSPTEPRAFATTDSVRTPPGDRLAAGLAGELQRVFWLAIGAGIGGLVTHLIHIA